MTVTAGHSTGSPTRESLTMTVGEFLLRRIREAGVGHAFGVPGDYNLELLQLEDTGTLEWIGACNELNASYAADGYARLNGLAALIGGGGRPSQGSDRRDVPSLRRHLQRQGKPAACTRGHRVTGRISMLSRCCGPRGP